MSQYLIFGIISVVIQLTSLIPYIHSMIKGTTRPNVVTWALWTLIQGIALTAQIVSGASWSVLLVMSMTVGTVSVLILALFFGYGYKRYSWIDGACFLIALGAIVLWQVTQNPLLAIWFAIVADFIAGVPTFVKVYREPFTENMLAWGIVIPSAAASLLAVETYDLANTLFPGYIFCIAIAATTFIFLRQRHARMLHVGN